MSSNNNKNNTKTRRVAIMIAIMLIPLIYSFFYLYAFWDPYSKLIELPVAVVNEDKGAIVEGNMKNAGNEIIDNLKTDKSLKWVFTDKASADHGLSKKEFYAEIYIPANFSDNISTADKLNKSEGLIIYKPNEKRNYLASQVLNRAVLELKERIQKNITKEIVGNMASELQNIPVSLKEMSDGASRISDGAKQLSEGAKSLENGQKQFNSGLSELNSGLKSAVAGTGKLSNGSETLKSGTSEFHKKLSEGSEQVGQLVQGSDMYAAGLDNLNSKVSQMGNGVAELKKGSDSLNMGIEQYSSSTAAFNKGLNTFLDSISTVADSNVKTAALLQDYIKKHPEAMNDPDIKGILGIYGQLSSGTKELQAATTNLKTTSGMLVAGAQKLQDGSKALTAGMDQFSKAASALPDGVSKLANSYGSINQGIKQVSGNLKSAAENAKSLLKGATSLNSGIDAINNGIASAYSGSNTLYQNSQKLLDGASKLNTGAAELKAGAEKMSSNVSKAMNDANSKVKGLDGIDSYASEPVQLDTQSINPVPDYGTAFAPYFISLSLWVGALIVFMVIFYDPFNRFKWITDYSRRLKGFIIYEAFGVIQAIILSVAVKYCLHMDVKSSFAYYAVCILTSLVFTTIVQFLIVYVGEVGKFLTILLLILQLTACGGTFPMELVPKFFNIISPFMPMTYSVNIMKEAISGIDYSNLYEGMSILVAIMVFAIVLMFVINKVKSLKTESSRLELNTEVNL